MPEAPPPDVALAFLARGRVPGIETPTEDDRVAFARTCLPVKEFKEKAWPHLACFIDASNVARHRRIPTHETNTPKARLADLDAVVDALKKTRYIPIVVSDGNLFQLIDEPYEYQRKYTQFPHSVAQRRQADSIVLHALRKLPEAAVVTNDRFAKPDELRDFADVRDAPHRFYRHRWEGDTPSFFDETGVPMPGALRRLARTIASRPGDEEATTPLAPAASKREP